MVFDSLIFDLDGTLWDCADTVAYSWSRALKRLGIEKTLTRDDLYREMGKTMDVIMEDFFPEMSFDERNALMPELCEEETRVLETRGGTLYDRVPEVLSLLRKKYRLFIVSNCQQGYIEAFLSAHSFADVFEGHLCWGDTGLSKGGTNRRLIEKYGLKAPVYIGDTEGDRLSAEEADIPFIHAAYGFGEVSCCDYRAESFSDLEKILLFT